MKPTARPDDEPRPIRSASKFLRLQLSITMNTSRTTLVAAALLLLAAVVPRAGAALIAYEPFDYPVASNLSSNAGGSGWVGTWICSPLITSHGTISPQI
jgi:hypothetical protein